MKILITENQYYRVLLEQQMELDFPEENDLPEETIIKYNNFNPGGTNQRNFVYINGIQSEDITKIKELKDSGTNEIVKLINRDTDEVIELPINKIQLTKATGAPYIFSTDYEELIPDLLTHEIKLDENFLKKSASGFPKFMTETLHKLYPSNLGKNSFINGNGVCNSEIGLINIQGTNIPGQTWSILNYFDTNPMVIRKLIDWYMDGIFNNGKTPKNVSIITFGDWLTNNATTLFKNSKYFDELVSINLKSYDSGTKTENITVKKLVEPPHNFSPKDIKQFCSGSKQDRIDGKDLEIVTPSGVKYAQVKPLGSITFNQENNTYTVHSYHMKNYRNKPIDYIIFTNSKEIVIFENKDYVVENNHYAIFKSAPVTSIV